MKQHEEKITDVSNQLKAAAAQGVPALITKKGNVSHFVPIPGGKKPQGQPVNIGELNEILEIDPDGRVCVCEPGVTFETLVRRTLEVGLIPAVVPELKGITVGGAVAGCSIEAMSYYVGGFHDNCLEYELITGTGEVLTCSPAMKSSLFEMVHGSYGTLAIVGKLKFKLVPALPFVRMRYETFPDYNAFGARLRTLCSLREFDFIDGIIHGPDRFVLCLGKFSERAPYVSRYDTEGIYYKSTAYRTEDYLETFDYCFRYDAECHWLSRTVPPLEWPWVRRMVGRWFLGSTNLITWSNRLGPLLKHKARRPDVVVDVFIPEPRMEEFWTWYERSFDFYPLWVVPYRSRHYPWINDQYHTEMATDLVIDCAVYGKPNNSRFVDYSELLEKKVLELRGLKTLISRNHFSEEEFWRVYHRENYLQAKQELDPNGAFPDLFETFHRR